MSTIKSMTGYAATSYDTCVGLLEISIKAVNGRFCDVNFAANFDLGTAELECAKLIKQSVKRGSINVSIKLTRDKSTAFNVNLDNVTELLNALCKIDSHINSHALSAVITSNKQLDLMALANMPGILSSTGNAATDKLEITSDLRPAFNEELLAAVKVALTAFETHRCEEGSRLKDVLLEKITSLSTLLDVIKDNLDNLVAMERSRLKEKIAKINIELDPERLESEVAILAQRADIAEEHDRLRSHIKSLLDILTKEPPVQSKDSKDNTTDSYTPAGKRLDFMMQELVRESNTIASKASNLEVTQTAVELKVIIEQMREQIQNIE